MMRAGLFVGVILAVVGAVYGWRTGIYERLLPPPPQVVDASLSIDCDYAQFPLTVQPGTNMCGLILERGKAPYVCSDQAQTANAQWPRTLRVSRTGFLCRLTNTAKAPMISLSM
jgi:hypothetical protein